MPTKTTKTKPVIEEKVEMKEEYTNSEDFITFKRSHFYSVLVVLAFAVGALSGVSWERYSAAKKAAANPPQQPAAQAPAVVVQPTAAPQYVRYDIPTEGYPSHGPEDA